MASYIACEDPGFARAYAPLAGSFRRPLPSLDECEGPVSLLYTHGWADEDVPIEGRSVWGGSFVQGDVFQAMQIWRHANGCTKQNPDSIDVGDSYFRRSWTTCAHGSLEFALHPATKSRRIGRTWLLIGMRRFPSRTSRAFGLLQDRSGHSRKGMLRRLCPADSTDRRNTLFELLCR